MGWGRGGGGGEEDEEMVGEWGGEGEGRMSNSVASRFSLFEFRGDPSTAEMLNCLPLPASLCAPDTGSVPSRRSIQQQPTGGAGIRARAVPGHSPGRLPRHVPEPLPQGRARLPLGFAVLRASPPRDQDGRRRVLRHVQNSVPLPRVSGGSPAALHPLQRVGAEHHAHRQGGRQQMDGGQEAFSRFGEVPLPLLQRLRRHPQRRSGSIPLPGRFLRARLLDRRHLPLRHAAGAGGQRDHAAPGIRGQVHGHGHGRGDPLHGGEASPLSSAGHHVLHPR